MSVAALPRLLDRKQIAAELNVKIATSRSRCVRLFGCGTRVRHRRPA